MHQLSVALRVGAIARLPSSRSVTEQLCRVARRDAHVVSSPPRPSSRHPCRLARRRAGRRRSSRGFRDPVLSDARTGTFTCEIDSQAPVEKASAAMYEITCASSRRTDVFW